MQSLLRWSIENSNGPPVKPREGLDPGIIDHILGKPDAVLMKEALEVAVDESKSEEERVAALDDFEMLIEQIDNANNIHVLKMWTPIQSLVQSPIVGVKTHALWIIGTALQNNPQAQISYLDHSSDSLSLIIQQLDDANPKTRSKSLYALSGLLKHNARAVSRLDGTSWKAIVNALQDPDVNVKRKIPFLLNSLLVPLPHDPPSKQKDIHANSHESHLRDPTFADTSPVVLDAMREYGVISDLVRLLENEQDEEWFERTLRLLYTFAVVCRGSFTDEEKVLVGSWFQKDGEKYTIDLDEDERAELVKAVSL